MSTQMDIEHRLAKAFQPSFLKVINESEKHRGHSNGPQGSDLTETHFTIKMISSWFNTLPRLDRHRLVYAVLAELMPYPIHALRLELVSNDEDSSFNLMQ